MTALALLGHAYRVPGFMCLMFIIILKTLAPNKPTGIVP